MPQGLKACRNSRDCRTYPSVVRVKRSDPQIWIFFLLCQAERNPPRWACRPALRFTSGHRSREGFNLRAELLNTPWRRSRFLAVCRSPCAGMVVAVRKELRLRSR